MLRATWRSPPAQVDRDRADLQDHEADGRGQGQPGGDAGQRRQDQPDRAEYFDHPDGPDGGHGMRSTQAIIGRS